MDDSLQKGTTQYLNGLAYDLYRNERAAFEGALGKYKANINNWR